MIRWQHRHLHRRVGQGRDEPVGAAWVPKVDPAAVLDPRRAAVAAEGAAFTRRGGVEHFVDLRAYLFAGSPLCNCTSAQKPVVVRFLAFLNCTARFRAVRLQNFRSPYFIALWADGRL